MQVHPPPPAPPFLQRSSSPTHTALPLHLLYVSEAGDHGANANEGEDDEYVELAAVEERRHDGDAQDARVRVVLPVMCSM